MADKESELQSNVRSVLQELSEEERTLLARVLQAEVEKLHMAKPRHINDDIWKALTEVIR